MDECDVCDKTIKLTSERKHLQSLTHNELGKSIQRKYTIENSGFFVIN